jgi:hypothetical protein
MAIAAQGFNDALGRPVGTPDLSSGFPYLADYPSGARIPAMENRISSASNIPAMASK